MIPNTWGRDIGEILQPQPERQTLPGFDPEYADIVDYILRCTHRIWEQKDIGLIETHYAPNCVMHMMTGPVAGVAGVVSGTIRTLAAFPDRTLLGEAVVWSDEGKAGYLSSHRIVSRGTNTGASEFGAATGRRVTFTTVADCMCRRNEIYEEWLMRDNSALVAQLGYDPRRIARDQAAVDIANGSRAAWRLEEMSRIRDEAPTPFRDAPLPDPIAEPHTFAEAVFDQAWNHRRFSKFREIYCPAARWEGPGGRALFGHDEIIGWFLALVGTFGDARFRVDHVAQIQQAEDVWEIAVRWSMTGTHDGYALYGTPTGRAVYILASTHWRVRNGRIVADWTVFDELALLRQLEGGL